jgi:hypothetical protein
MGGIGYDKSVFSKRRDVEMRLFFFKKNYPQLHK